MADTSGTVTITAMLFESSPFMTPSGYEDPAPLAPEYVDLDQCWVDVLKTLLVNVDTARCWRCDEPVGFTLSGDNDRFAEWVSTGFAREGDGPVAVLCEECTPYVPTRPESTS